MAPFAGIAQSPDLPQEGPQVAPTDRVALHWDGVGESEVGVIGCWPMVSGCGTVGGAAQRVCAQGGQLDSTNLAAASQPGVGTPSDWTLHPAALRDGILAQYSTSQRPS